MTTGYCTKCRAKHEIKGAEDIITKNGRNAVQGSYSKCGKTVTCFTKSK